MSVCTFFGDSKCGKSIYPCLLAVTEELIVTEKVSTFYVGDKGVFDALVQKALHELMQKYPDIKCYIVLSYIPGKKKESELPPLLETIYPEGMEKVPPRFAINHRNLWMLDRSSFVISYPSPFENSAKLADAAFLKGKNVIDLSEEMKEIFPFQK